MDEPRDISVAYVRAMASITDEACCPRAANQLREVY